LPREHTTGAVASKLPKEKPKEHTTENIARMNKYRFAFVYDRLMKGWSADIAGLVARVVFPFDDSPVPPRSLEKQVRKRSRKFAREARKAKHDQNLSLSLAISVAEDYVNIARQNDSEYFVNLWQNLKDQIDELLNSFE